MITAKLFAAAAAAFALVTLVMTVRGGNPTSELYLPDTYYVVVHRGVTAAAAGLCMVFALLYFASVRWLRVPLKTGLSVLSFLLLVIAPIALILEARVLRLVFQSGSAPQLTKFVPLFFFLPSLCFLLGLVLFAANFTSAFLRRLQAQR